MERLARIAKGRAIVIAHRGDSGACPENTVVAFASAMEVGADVVELDYYESKDGVLVCVHDETLDRTTDSESTFGKKATVAALTAAELSTLDAGTWKDERFAGTKIPRLDEVLDEFGRQTILMIEHKQGEPERIVALLRGKGLVEGVLLQSFDWEFLAAVKRLEPRIALGALGDGTISSEVEQRLAALAPAFVHWKAKDLDVASLRAISRSKRPLFVYTVNDVLTMAGAASLGVDGVTTDFPARLLELIESDLARDAR